MLERTFVLAPDEDDRDVKIYRLRVVNRLSLAEIGQRFDLSPQRIGQIVAKVSASLPPVDLDAVRRQSMELYDEIERQALALAEREGAPVFVGKDGDMAIDTDGRPVRDYALRLAALETARKASLERRKLLGLDAATKTEISGSVRYEVAGVDIEALS